MPNDVSLSNSVTCDDIGCIGKLADGRLVSMVLSVEGFAEDCTRAAVVISPREAPSRCAATLIDRKVWRANGAMALRWTGDRFEQVVTRAPGYERPWARGAADAPSTQASAPPASRDAAPRSEDLETGD
jgi:competence protein ComEC